MTEEIIKKFLTTMATQDNRGTSFPYYYVIKDYRLELNPDGDIERYTFTDSEGYWSKERIIEKVKDEYLFFEDSKIVQGLEDSTVFYDFAELLKTLEGDAFDNIEYYTLSNVEYTVDSRMFLTEEDAELHLKANHYHYTSKARTYVCDIWRSPYLEEFLTALFKHFDIKHEQIK